jgi:hypothetical protein
MLLFFLLHFWLRLDDCEERGESKSESEEKAKRFYRSCMDKNETQEKLGAGPLKELLVRVGGWSISPSNFSLDKWSFQTQLQFLHNDINMGGFFTWAVGEDDRNSTRHIIQVIIIINSLFIIIPHLIMLCISLTMKLNGNWVESYVKIILYFFLIVPDCVCR